MEVGWAGGKDVDVFLGKGVTGEFLRIDGEGGEEGGGRLGVVRVAVAVYDAAIGRRSLLAPVRDRQLPKELTRAAPPARHESPHLPELPASSPRSRATLPSPLA